VVSISDTRILATFNAIALPVGQPQLNCMSALDG
jgi:hypothetical protein